MNNDRITETSKQQQEVKKRTSLREIKDVNKSNDDSKTSIDAALDNGQNSKTPEYIQIADDIIREVDNIHCMNFYNTHLRSLVHKSSKDTQMEAQNEIYIQTSDSTNSVQSNNSESHITDVKDTSQAKSNIKFIPFKEFGKIKLDVKAYNDLGQDQKEFTDKGIARFTKIQATRPRDVNEFNAKVIDEYIGRYNHDYDSYPNKDKDDYKAYQFETYVEGHSDQTCYLNVFRGDGKAWGIKNYKDKPSSFEDNDDFKAYDSYWGKGALHHAKIMYAHIESIKDILIDFKLQEWAGPKVIEPETQRVMDLFVKERDRPYPFEEGHPAYYAMVATPTGNGKWYLAEHHLDMKVSAVELEITSDGKYHTKYYFADKSNNESS